ncbi:MAG TPA: aminoacyl-tRNA hydrolase [Candidatus Saccharimonadales bacterium]|nr:aminoacyl-tRNA hydrolase [Candidatus Saccharimonadales bacterium]
MKIIFAQGNPGDKYARSRHNVGFLIVNKLAEDAGSKWVDKSKLHAHIAEVSINDEKVFLIKPTTFYNETGKSARAIVDFYKIDPEKDFLAVHDDLALPFGTIRSRQKGSDAGNNGIKSLNSHIGESYSRIRVGVWNDLRDRMDDADFVLSSFSKDESEALQSIATMAIDDIKAFLSDTIVYDTKKIDLANKSA